MKRNACDGESHSDKPPLTKLTKTDDFLLDLGMDLGLYAMFFSFMLSPIKKHPKASILALIAILAPVSLWIGLDYCDFRQARKIHSARSYEAYLEAHRNGLFRDKAKDGLYDEYPWQCGNKLREAFFGSPESISQLRMMIVYQAVNQLESHNAVPLPGEWVPFLKSWLAEFDVFVSGLYRVRARDIGRIAMTPKFLDAIGLSDSDIEASKAPVVKWESQHKEIETRVYTKSSQPYGHSPRTFEVPDGTGGVLRIPIGEGIEVARRRVEGKMRITREGVTAWEETRIVEDCNFPIEVRFKEGTEKVFLSSLPKLREQIWEALDPKVDRELQTPYRPLISDWLYAWKYDSTSNYDDYTHPKMEKQFLAISCAQILLGWDSKGTENLQSMAKHAEDPDIQALAENLYYGEYDQFPDLD